MTFVKKKNQKGDFILLELKVYLSLIKGIGFINKYVISIRILPAQMNEQRRSKLC
jgi:hypothetical protein